MKRSGLMTSILILSLVAVWQYRTPPAESAPAPAVAQSRAELSVTGPVLFQPTPHDLVYVADFPVTLKGSGGTQTTKTDLLGRYRFRDVAPGKYTVCWEQAGWEKGCTEEVEVTAGNSAYPRAVQLKPSAPNSVAWGDVRLADGSSAVTIDRGSAMEQVPLVEVLDASGKTVGSGRTNAVGKYAIGVSGAAATIRVSSEAARQEVKMLAAKAAAVGGAGAHNIRLSNHSPKISKIGVFKGTALTSAANPGDTLTLRPTATDPDGDRLTYHWSASGGTITSAADGTATWQMPAFPARLVAWLLVTDGKAGSDRQSITLRCGAPKGPPSCKPLSLANVPPPSGYSPGPPVTPPNFLTFLLTRDNSATYYQNVDPKGLRGTLGAWWKAAGFNPSNGSGGVARAAYLNWNDLGFGRDMHFNQVGNSVYAWVTNYGCPDNNPQNANLAAKPVPADAVATVCMEYAPVEGTTQPIVKFFVYVGGVAGSTRTGQANLDEWGNKPVPNLCQTCHGGTTPYNGGTNVDLAANFIPFDLALLQYPGPSKKPPASDLPAYHKMNSIIAQVTNPRTAIANLVKGWYTPLKTPPTQNNNYLPTGWQTSARVPPSAGGLYQNVIVPGCRSCHYSFSSRIDWDSYSSALNDNSTIKAYVCAPQPVMPHAAVTYVNFWTNAYSFPTSPPAFLGKYSDSNWTSFGGCTGK